MPFGPGNPHGNRRGRKPIRTSLAEAVREKWPPSRIVAEAEKQYEAASEVKDFKAASSVLLFLAGYGYGKPTEHVEVNAEPELTPEEYADELKAIGKEYVESLSADRRAELLNPVPTDTIQ